MINTVTERQVSCSNHLKKETEDTKEQETKVQVKKNYEIIPTPPPPPPPVMNHPPPPPPHLSHLPIIYSNNAMHTESIIYINNTMHKE